MGRHRNQFWIQKHQREDDSPVFKPLKQDELDVLYHGWNLSHGLPDTAEEFEEWFRWKKIGQRFKEQIYAERL